MKKETAIKLFNQKQVRCQWNDTEEKWYFSVIDIIEVLTDSKRPRKYWGDLKKKITDEGGELSEKIGQLKMEAADGKKYKTDVADTETVLRLIQSIPSPKAEPFKIWLAKVGYERIEETEEYKKFKDLKKENLRDNMTNLELVLNMLAEASTTEISKEQKPETFQQNKNVAKKGGEVAKVARKQLEKNTGKNVVTNLNAKTFLEEKKKKELENTNEADEIKYKLRNNYE